MTVPGTAIPICLVCEDDAASHQSSGIGHARNSRVKS